jgi:hypothetical protein
VGLRAILCDLDDGTWRAPSILVFNITLSIRSSLRIAATSATLADLPGNEAGTFYLALQQAYFWR